MKNCKSLDKNLLNTHPDQTFKLMNVNEVIDSNSTNFTSYGIFKQYQITMFDSVA